MMSSWSHEASTMSKKLQDEGETTITNNTLP